ncbi:hypothetical protein EB796_020562 [Bugula neritina]|uniref:Uncharacterized protein n=1 Tax=Bugula neritina TaxID=10212 RepID=A0A7J7J4L9_BUGNE|nr:hypothetical protein EB796_020562 [Bugula neritina]
MWSGDVLIATKHRVLLPEAKFWTRREFLLLSLVTLMTRLFLRHLMVKQISSNHSSPYLRRRFSATYGTEQ